MPSAVPQWDIAASFCARADSFLSMPESASVGATSSLPKPVDFCLIWLTSFRQPDSLLLRGDHHLRSIRIDQAARAIAGFGFPLAPKMGGSSPTTAPSRPASSLSAMQTVRSRGRRNSCRYRARPLCPQGLNPLDRSFQTARSFGDGDGGDGSGGDNAIPIKLSITLASANSPASVGGKSLPKTGPT